MLERIFGDNWQVIVPLIGAGVALFFPQLKPFIDAFIRPNPAPGPPAPNPFPPIVPVPPSPQPGPPQDWTPIVVALQVLMAWFRSTNNKAGEEAVRAAGKALFDEEATASGK